MCKIIKVSIFFFGLIILFICSYYGLKMLNICNSVGSCLNTAISLWAALGTVSVAILALFRDEIMGWIHPENCDFKLQGVNGFEEKLDENDNSPVVRYYAGDLLISNVSKREIDGFQIIIKEATYASKTDLSRKKKLRILNNGTMHWGENSIYETTLQSQGECWMPLFRIFPAADMASPDGTNSSKLSLRIMGVKDVEASIPQCVWTVRYQLRSRRGIIKTVELNIDWDGQWNSRKTEMNSHLKATLK